MQIPDAIFYIYAYAKRRVYSLRHENERIQSKTDSEQIPNDTTVRGNGFAWTRTDGKLEGNTSNERENTVQTRLYIEETSTIEIEDEIK